MSCKNNVIEIFERKTQWYNLTQTQYISSFDLNY